MGPLTFTRPVAATCYSRTRLCAAVEEQRIGVTPRNHDGFRCMAAKRKCVMFQFVAGGNLPMPVPLRCADEAMSRNPPMRIRVRSGNVFSLPRHEGATESNRRSGGRGRGLRPGPGPGCPAGSGSAPRAGSSSWIGFRRAPLSHYRCAFRARPSRPRARGPRGCSGGSWRGFPRAAAGEAACGRRPRRGRGGSGRGGGSPRR